MPPCFDGSSPSEVKVEIFGRNAVEGTQPFLETAVIAVDVVDVQIGCLRPRPTGRGQDLARNVPLAGETDNRLAAIAAQLIVRCDNALQSDGDRGPVELGEPELRVSYGIEAVIGFGGRGLI